MTQFKKFRKKPIEVEAFYWDGKLDNDLSEELGADVKLENKTLTIKTLEGEMTAQVGDWIIRGVNGELYPCKPDIFEKTYEKI